MEATIQRIGLWLGTLASLGALGLGAWGLTGTEKPAVAASSPAPGAEPRVWLNRRTGVYHLEGCRWFDRTADGVFLSVPEAMKAGLPCGHCIPSGGHRAKVRRTPREVKVFVLQ